MLAFAMMATIRHHANAVPPPKSVMKRMQKQNQHWSAGPYRKSDASPRASQGRTSNLHTLSHGRSGDEHIRPPHNKHTSNQNRSY